MMLFCYLSLTDTMMNKNLRKLFSNTVREEL